jgi:DNA-binding transcriptional LysR family regulator
MHLDDLDLFITIAEVGGITAAAKRLGQPKSTVSRGLTRLEEALGVALVQRTTRHVTLTSAGEALLARAAAPLVVLRSALSDLPESEKQPSGRLRVTAPVDFGATVLADIVARFTLRYPLVEVDARLSSSVLDLVADAVDVALRLSARPLRNSSLVARRAAPVAMKLFASPEYLARRGVPTTFDDLAEHDWVVYRGLPALAPGHASAVAGSGVAVLPTFLAEPDVVAGRLARVLPKLAFPSGTLWIVYVGGNSIPANVKAFRDFVLDALKHRSLG